MTRLRTGDRVRLRPSRECPCCWPADADIWTLLADRTGILTRVDPSRPDGHGYHIRFDLSFPRRRGRTTGVVHGFDAAPEELVDLESD